MSTASVVEPHDKMRARDVNKVARGEQAPRPPKQSPDVSKPPSPSSISTKQSGDGSKAPPSSSTTIKVEEAGTAPTDWRFPCTNQTRHCYTRYLEYHKCIHGKGKGAPECEKFAKYYRSLCPSEWIERWNEQRELGIFPGLI